MKLPASSVIYTRSGTEYTMSLKRAVDDVSSILPPACFPYCGA